MNLVRLPGPFDARIDGPRPATPTCCCCCCCLVTTLTASTMAAVTVHREAEISELAGSRRRLLTAGAALVVVLGLVLASGLGTGLSHLGAPDWVVIVLWVSSVLAVWLVWMRLVLGWAGSPPFPAWWWSSKFALAAGLAFTAEVFTIGFLFYGQLAAVPLAVLVGVVMRRRFKASGP